MIIVEGPDGAGKTHLIQAMSNRYRLPIAERVVTKEATALTELSKWVERENNKGFQAKLFDRHRLVSNPIYSPILGKATQPMFSDVPWVIWQTSRLYNYVKPIIIYCLPPLEVVRENVYTGDDNLVVQTKIDQLYEAYVARAAIDNNNPNIFSTVYDYTWDGGEKDPLSIFDNPIRTRFQLNNLPFLINKENQ